MSEQNRKTDHITLSQRCQNLPRIDWAALTGGQEFDYEPLLAPLPTPSELEKQVPLHFSFGRHTLNAPFWISSMTGGTAHAGLINSRLATLANRFGLGLALGSCRPLLRRPTPALWADYRVRTQLGPDLPLYANLGIAQIEQAIYENRDGGVPAIIKMLHELQADGLVVHINPLQEWAQPEGDRYQRAPIETLRRLLDQLGFPVIVKEVGSGLGPRSLAALGELDLMAIELAGHGGTNFVQIELERRTDHPSAATGLAHPYAPLAGVGHTTAQMIQFLRQQPLQRPCHLILSGGIRSALEGYALMQTLQNDQACGPDQQSQLAPLIGLAYPLLALALESQASLHQWMEQQIALYRMATLFLSRRSNDV